MVFSIFLNLSYVNYFNPLCIISFLSMEGRTYFYLWKEGRGLLSMEGRKAGRKASRKAGRQAGRGRKALTTNTNKLYIDSILKLFYMSLYNRFANYIKCYKVLM